MDTRICAGFQFALKTITVLASFSAPSRTKMYCLRRLILAALFSFLTRIGITRFIEMKMN